MVFVQTVETQLPCTWDMYMCSWTKLAFSKNKFSPFKRHFSCKIYFGKTFPNHRKFFNCMIIFYKYTWYMYMYMFVLLCLTPLSTIFQLYRGGQFFGWRKLNVPGVNHNVITDKLYQIMLYCLSGIRIHNISSERWSVTTVYINDVVFFSVSNQKPLSDKSNRW